MREIYKPTWFFLRLSVAFLVVEFASIFWRPLFLMGYFGVPLSLMLAILSQIITSIWRDHKVTPTPGDRKKDNEYA